MSENLASCLACGSKCCRGMIELFPADIIYTDDEWSENAAGLNIRVMKTRDGGICKAIGEDGRCTIYGKRPLKCRLFKVDSQCCRHFRYGAKTQHDCTVCPVNAMTAIVSDEFAGYTLKLVASVRKVLEFYAHGPNYHTTSTGFCAQYDPEPTAISADDGELARKTLEVFDKQCRGVK